MIAQDLWILRGGLGVGAQIPIGSFLSPSELPNPPDPLTFSGAGVSWRPTINVGADYRIDSRWRLGADVGLNWYALGYKATEQTVISTPSGTVRNATISHSLSMKLSTISLRPYGRWLLSPSFAFEFGLPLQVLAATDYLQTMRFADPPNLTFVDGSLEKETGSGNVPGSSSIAVGIDAGIEWIVPVTEQIDLTSHLTISTNLSSWHTSAPIRSINITPQVGIRFNPWAARPSMVMDTTYARDTVRILSGRVLADSTELLLRKVDQRKTADTTYTLITESYRTYIPKPPAVLHASLKLLFEGADGKLQPEATMNVKTVKRTRIVPVLPLVIFDEASAAIPSRYVTLTASEAKRFTVNMALTQGIHWQYHVLNIAGARLRANRGMSADLIAYDDGTTEGKTLARERATNVKQYLVSTFGLADRQLVIDVRNGQRSQQPWVFVVDTLRRVLAPIQATDTVTETRLPKVRITPEVVSEAGIRSWRIAITQAGTLVSTNQGNGLVPATLIWDMNEDLEPAQAFARPIDVLLSVTDTEGSKAQSMPGVITLQETAATNTTAMQERTEVLRWIGADYLHTPDVDLFGTTPQFDRVDVYPSSSRRADFFVVQVPATMHTVGAKAWFRDGLQQPEAELFEHAELYVKDLR